MKAPVKMTLRERLADWISGGALTWERGTSETLRQEVQRLRDHRSTLQAQIGRGEMIRKTLFQQNAKFQAALLKIAGDPDRDLSKLSNGSHRVAIRTAREAIWGRDQK